MKCIKCQKDIPFPHPSKKEHCDECWERVCCSFDSLVRVSKALTNFEYIMSQPRMDADKQRDEAIEALSGVWCRKTQRQFRVLMMDLKP